MELLCINKNKSQDHQIIIIIQIQMLFKKDMLIPIYQDKVIIKKIILLMDIKIH